MAKALDSRMASAVSYSLKHDSGDMLEDLASRLLYRQENYHDVPGGFLKEGPKPDVVAELPASETPESSHETVCSKATVLPGVNEPEILI